MTADPFDPLSPGVHITDQGARYLVASDLLDVLGAGELDVYGCMVQVVGGWPSVIIELNVRLQILRDIDDDDDRLHVEKDLLPEALALRGFQLVTGFTVPPPTDPIQVTVRHRPNDPDRSGVFAPGIDGGTAHLAGLRGSALAQALTVEAGRGRLYGTIAAVV